MQPHDSVWSGYNARSLSPELIARSFVQPQQFQKISLARNTVLLGSRGSGKTTLLRMLDPRALANWDDPRAEAVVANIRYIGVYVPVDASWISSLRATRLAAEDPERFVPKAVYALAMGRELIQMLLWRSGQSVQSQVGALQKPLSVSDEIGIAKELSELWLPSSKARSLVELSMLLTKEIALVPRKWLAGCSSTRSGIADAYDNIVQLAIATCEIFNSFTGEHKKVWTLLCDELEIAPRPVQEQLFTAIRAAPSVVQLKLAFSPATKSPLSFGPDQPAAKHDYDVVSLTYPTREEGADNRNREEFCGAMWKLLVAERFPEKSSELENPDAVLRSFKQIKGHSASKLAGDSRDKAREIFEALNLVDGSFAKFISEKKISLTEFSSNSQDLFDSVIRKIRPLAEWRLYYLRQELGSSRRMITKRGHDLYCGASGLFALSEGHPRWLKATLGAMLDQINQRDHTVSVAVQAREIELSIARLESRIGAFPVEAANGVSVSAIVNAIGEFFRFQVLEQNFKGDPYLSFTIDKDVGPNILDPLERAVHIGALIPMDLDSDTAFQEGMCGHRFRLSNWLAPRFKLPLLAGKAVQLSRILEWARVSAVVDEKSTQLDLGFPNAYSG